jgi:hypothetical protein
MHNSFIQQQQFVYRTVILDMFWALACPSSGGEIVYTQHLASLLSVDVCTVHRLRVDSALILCTVQTSRESEDTRCCVYTISPPEDGHANAQNMSRMTV